MGMMGREFYLRRKPAQMAVELAVCVPVMIVVSVVVVNALLFFSECAAYDNAFRESVRIHASSPSYGQNLPAVLGKVDAQLAQRFTGEYKETTVAVRGTHAGHAIFTGTLVLRPTLFGMGLRSHVLGVSMPNMTHSVSLTIDSYKPGVFL